MKLTVKLRRKSQLLQALGRTGPVQPLEKAHTVENPAVDKSVKQDSQQKILNKQAIAASMAAQKAAQAAEASIKLASFASKQLEKASEAAASSKAVSAKSPPCGKVAELPVLSSETLSPETKSPESKPANNTSTAAGSSEPAAKLAKVRAPRGTKQTFAGRKPPQGEDASEAFFLKKKLFEETHEELQKKYPGKKITSGATGNQQAYWDHLKAHLEKTKKQKKNGSMTQAEVRDAIKDGASLWKKSLVDKLSKKSGNQ